MRRRDMIAGAGAAMLASPVVAAESTRIPAALPEDARQVAHFVDLPDKRRLLQLTERPLNCATPVNVFTDAVTPNDRFYVRYHLAGAPSVAEPDNWAVSIGGDAVDRSVRLTMGDLQDLPSNALPAVCASAGNRRGFLAPHVAGVQWTDGGMGCAVWRGPALRDVLKAAGVRPDALEVWLGGAERTVPEGLPPYRKSLPMEKALDGDTIVAIAMNDAPLPLLNGSPVRLVVPGWVGDYWVKHLASIEVRATPLRNDWMQGDNRVPAGLFPVAHPFRSQADGTTVPVTELVVGSVIGDPLDGQELDRSGFTIRGVAWDRGAGISRVEVSLDGGHSWQDALLDRTLGPYAYRRFSLDTGLLPRGSYRLMTRATSNTGERQADRFRANPGGYLNNVPLPITVVTT